MALSDFLSPALQIGSTVLSAGGQIARGISAAGVGKRRKQALDFEADQLDQEAAQASGVGLRKAADEGLKARLVNSAALARAAASGAGASDPTVVNLMARTAGEGAYRQALAMYEGEAQARLDRLRANAARYEGDVAQGDANVARTLSNVGAASTVLSGGAKALSMYDKYWAGPKRDGQQDMVTADLGPVGQNLDFG